MNSSNPKFKDGKTGVALTVRVTPRSKKNEIVEILDDGTVKIRLTAPPLEGRANKVLVQFLAEVLSVPESRIDIVAGETGRNKLVTIVDMDAKELQARINHALGAQKG
ncbi:MAG: YggU family protein [Chloroflexi bacterium]|nr:YggU family protein [Chloroflexota bacterium]